MESDKYKVVTGLIGIVLLATFTIGLTQSISAGFAGFWGSLPVWVIVISVLAMAIYDYWDSCLRKRS